MRKELALRRIHDDRTLAKSAAIYDKLRQRLEDKEEEEEEKEDVKRQEENRTFKNVGNAAVIKRTKNNEQLNRQVGSKVRQNKRRSGRRGNVKMIRKRKGRKNGVGKRRRRRKKKRKWRGRRRGGRRRRKKVRRRINRNMRRFKNRRRRKKKRRTNKRRRKLNRRRRRRRKKMRKRMRRLKKKWRMKKMRGKLSRRRWNRKKKMRKRMKRLKKMWRIKMRGKLNRRGRRRRKKMRKGIKGFKSGRKSASLSLEQILKRLNQAEYQSATTRGTVIGLANRLVTLLSRAHRVARSWRSLRRRWPLVRTVRLFTVLLRRSETLVASIRRRRRRTRALTRRLKLAVLYLDAIVVDLQRAAGVLRARTGPRVLSMLQLAVRTQRNAVLKAIRGAAPSTKKTQSRGNDVCF